MHHFKRMPPKMKWYKGLGVLALLVGTLVAASFLSRVAASFLPSVVCTLAFYAIGIAVALYVMRRFVMGYSYILTGTLLRLSHCYSKHERVITDIYLSTLLAYGTEEELRKRYPQSKVLRVVLRSDPAEIMGIAYRDGKTVEIVLMQPDEKIRDHLIATIREDHKK